MPESGLDCPECPEVARTMARTTSYLLRTPTIKVPLYLFTTNVSSRGCHAGENALSLDTITTIKLSTEVPRPNENAHPPRNPLGP